MSMWILAIILMGVFATLGFFKGAIRTTISLVGVILGVILSVPLSNLVLPLMGLFGVKNPVWLALIPPVVVFLIVYFAFIGISFAVHHKIHLYYKYRRDDADRIRWERVNRHTGLAVGLLTGALYFFLLCAVIYAAGYLTVQLSAEENNPAPIKFINTARGDMASSGFDKAVAGLDPAPPMYYQAADVLGLLYHNPLLQSRLSTYPYFLKLADRPEFQELATDKEYNDLIFGKAPITQIIEHPRTQALLSNAEIMNYLKGTDINDLKEYLRTGKSPKYAEEPILGVWNLDKDEVLTSIRKSNPDIRSRELKAIKLMLDSTPTFGLAMTPDKEVLVRVETPAPVEPSPEEAAAVDPAQAMRDRYNMQPNPAAQPAPAAVAPPQNNVIPQFTGEGTWTEQAGQYLITLPTGTGQDIAATAIIQGDEMSLNIVGSPALEFVKQ